MGKRLFTKEEVIEFRNMYHLEGMTVQSIKDASGFDTCYSVFYCMLTGQTYRDIPMPTTCKQETVDHDAGEYTNADRNKELAEIRLLIQDLLDDVAKKYCLELDIELNKRGVLILDAFTGSRPRRKINYL